MVIHKGVVRSSKNKTEQGKNRINGKPVRFIFRVDFPVSLCLKANAEMVPKIPSCHYMLLT